MRVHRNGCRHQCGAGRTCKKCAPKARGKNRRFRHQVPHHCRRLFAALPLNRAVPQNASVLMTCPLARKCSSRAICTEPLRFISHSIRESCYCELVMVIALHATRHGTITGQYRSMNMIQFARGDSQHTEHIATRDRSPAFGGRLFMRSCLPQRKKAGSHEPALKIRHFGIWGSPVQHACPGSPGSRSGGPKEPPPIRLS